MERVEQINRENLERIERERSAMFTPLDSSALATSRISDFHPDIGKLSSVSSSGSEFSYSRELDSFHGQHNLTSVRTNNPIGPSGISMHGAFGSYSNPNGRTTGHPAFNRTDEFNPMNPSRSPFGK